MKRLVFAAVLSSVLSGCLLVPGRYGPEVVAVPPLPQIVELLDDAFYVQGDYWYYYNGGDWRYGHSRNGPWYALPPDHYPREVRRGHGHEGGHEEERGRGDHDRD